MKPLPDTDPDRSLLLRGHFTDEAAWRRICQEVQEPVGEFRAYLECVSDPAYDGIEPAQLVAIAAESPYRGFIFVVDRTTVTHPEHPVLVVDLQREPGRTFRVIPRQMSAVENNLSLANMDFHEFADAAGMDGIFRGFQEL